MKTSILNNKNIDNKKLNKKYQIISILIILTLWTIFAYVVDNTVKIPSPYETFIELIKIICNDKFLLQVTSTLTRVIISFSIAFVLGLVLGVVSGFNEGVYYLLNPIILILKSMPTMAVILLSLIWLGREISPILVCFLICFPIIYTAVVNGIVNIDKKLLEMTDIYRFTKSNKLKHLYLPSIKSALVTISATSFSLTIKVCIAAEVLSQPKYSMGTGFQMEKVALNTAGVLAWSVIAIVIAGIFELLITKILDRKIKF